MGKKQNRATTDTTEVSSSTAEGTFEERTGVTREEIEAKTDTTPLVRAEPDTTFSERTSAVQPWAEYQEEAAKAEAKNAKEESKRLAEEAQDEE